MIDPWAPLRSFDTAAPLSPAAMGAAKDRTIAAAIDAARSSNRGGKHVTAT